jgi:hypothetical protein
MPSWGIHLKLAKQINNKLKLNIDLFTFGNLIPDVDDDSIYTRKYAHYYTGIRFNKCPNELEIDLKQFLNDYKDKFDNPMIVGYYCHILTDEFYNEYIYTNKWIQDENKNIIGIKCNDGNIIDISKNFRESLKYKHEDLEKYGRYIYNSENLYVPKDTDIILKNSDILIDKFYSKKNIEHRINYLNNGGFKEFNKLSDDDNDNKYKYLLFNQKELDNLFDKCYLYVIQKLKEEGIFNEE